MTYTAGTSIDRFVIERLAGEGGGGGVYRARGDRGEPVALKIFHERAPGRDREARTLLELAHPNIVRCLAFGTTEAGHDYLVTEWLEGETLRDRLSRGPLPIAQTIRIARRVADGLAVAHAWGIVHRDVTPANVMLVGSSTEEVKLVDFGLAMRGRSEGSAGTIGYAAPEQARGQQVSPRADVFSLGCIIYECVLGERPFNAETDVGVISRMLEGDTARVTARLTGMPDGVVRLLARMLASDPDGRPHDGAAVAAELAALGEAPVPSRSRSSVTGAEMRGSQVLVAETDEGDARMRAELEALGGSVTVEDGRIVSTWSVESSAVERAVRGARAALAIRRWNAHARVALVVSSTGGAGREAAQGQLPDTPSIHVDTDTARLLGDRFVVRPEGDDLVLVRGSSPHSHTTFLGRETKCVGRDREIGLIASVFEECKTERGARVVWLTGAPGIGKTRVRDEVIARLVAGAARVWSAQADPTRGALALGVLADLVRSGVGVARDDDETYQVAALASRAEVRLPQDVRAPAVELLSELLRIEVAEPSAQLRAARQEPMLMGEQVRRAAESLVLAELEQGPLALVVEDLQWADAASVRALSDIARFARDKPLFILLVGRPEAKDALIRLIADRQPTGVALGKLGTKSMEKLVAVALACAEGDPRVAAIADRAAGNPFFAEEIARATKTGDAPPAAALAILEARLSSVEPEARRVLRAASVVGQQFASRAVAALLGDDATVEFVDAWCAWLAERELLAQAGNVWSFRHALVRDAAYGMLTADDRKTAHAHAAQQLEGQETKATGRVPAPVVAEHWLRAAMPARAARWLAKAAEDALEANDLNVCVDLGERALSTLDDSSKAARGDLLLLLAEAHRWRGDYARARQCAADALGQFAAGEPRFFRAAAELAAITGSVGPDEQFETAIELLTKAPHAHGDAASIAWSRAAMQLVVRSDPRGDTLLERAREAADSDLARGRVEQAYAVRAGIRGDLEELVHRSEASVRALERAGDARGACVQELNLASALCELGASERAHVCLTRGAKEAERRGLLSAVALARHLDGILLARESRVVEALTAQRAALETFAAQRNARMEGGVRCHLAEILLRLGKNEEALRQALAASDLLAPVPPAQARGLAVLALVHVARGDVAAALEASARAIVLADRSGVESGESLVYRARADALALAGSAESEAVRANGRDKLAARAAAIADPTLRQSFLSLQENAALLRGPDASDLDARVVLP